MKLDRDINDPTKLGKYALILNRKVEELRSNEVTTMLNRLIELGVLDMGNTPDTEFFVMRLKDEGAGPGLAAYASHFFFTDPEWCDEVNALARRAAQHPSKKKPD